MGSESYDVSYPLNASGISLQRSDRSETMEEMCKRLQKDPNCPASQDPEENGAQQKEREPDYIAEGSDGRLIPVHIGADGGHYVQGEDGEVVCVQPPPSAPGG